MANCIGISWIIQHGSGPDNLIPLGRVHVDPYARVYWSYDQAGCPSNVLATITAVALRNTVIAVLYPEDPPAPVQAAADWMVEAERRVCYWNGGASDRP
jgi:hypothetical protein